VQGTNLDKNNQPLFDALEPQFSTVQAHRDNVLQGAPDIALRCITTNACGSISSNVATWRLCKADFDCSGGVAVTDIYKFLHDWFAQVGLTGPGHTADFNENQVVNVADIFAYLKAFFAGCN
jgi:hypothetical protein